MLCEAETTANSDVFELAVAQNTAIYSVFEPAVKKHRNLRRFQQHGPWSPKTLLFARCFYIFAQRTEASAMYKNTAKNKQTMQKNRPPQVNLYLTVVYAIRMITP